MTNKEEQDCFEIKSDHDEQDQQEVPSFTQIKGLKFRKRLDPVTTTQRDLYRIERKTKYTIKGKRIYFQIYLGGNVLFSTKMKGKRPDDPLPIAKGPEMHYSASEFAGFLHPGNGHTLFSLRAQAAYGTELLSVLFESVANAKLPKKIRVTFFLKDSLIPTKLVSADPNFNEDGYYELNFHNKQVIPSIKNCILINEDNNCEYIMIRKVSDDVVEADAVTIVSALSVFAIGLALFQSPF